MRIALCGSGGTGKTVTAIEMCARLKYKHLKSQARRVFERHKCISIENDFNQDVNKYIEVQRDILSLQIQLEAEASEVSLNWIAERTVLDTAAYFSFWAAALPLRGGHWARHANLLKREALGGVNRALLHVSRNPYDRIFLMPYGRFQLHPDSMRSGDAMYQRTIDMMIRGLIQQALPHLTTNVPMLDGRNEAETAKWIIDKAGLTASHEGTGMPEESDRIVEETAKQDIRCVLRDHRWDFDNDRCYDCWAEEKAWGEEP